MAFGCCQGSGPLHPFTVLPPPTSWPSQANVWPLVFRFLESLLPQASWPSGRDGTIPPGSLISGVLAAHPGTALQIPHLAVYLMDFSGCGAACT